MWHGHWYNWKYQMTLYYYIEQHCNGAVVIPCCSHNMLEYEWQTWYYSHNQLCHMITMMKVMIKKHGPQHVYSLQKNHNLNYLRHNYSLHFDDI